MTGENCIIYEFNTCYPIIPCMLSLGMQNEIKQAGITLHLQIRPIFIHAIRKSYYCRGILYATYVSRITTYFILWFQYSSCLTGLFGL